MAELREFLQATDRLLTLDARFTPENHTITSLTIFKNKVQQLWEDVDVAHDVYMPTHGAELTEPQEEECRAVKEKYATVFNCYALLQGQIETLLHRMRAEERLKDTEETQAAQIHRDMICQNAAPNTNHEAASRQLPTLHIPTNGADQLDDKSLVSNMNTPIDPLLTYARLSGLATSHQREEMYTHRLPLPPCEIEVFKGTYASWPTFRDMFTAVIIRNSRLSNVERLFHLRSKTVGEAHDLVSRVPLTHDGFEVAWQSLTATYENKRVLVNSQLKRLFNLPIIVKESSHGIKQLVREISSAIQILKMHSISTDNWDPIIVFLCCQRLPEAAIALFEQSLMHKTALPSWNDLQSFLTTRILTLEAIAETRTSSLTAARPQPPPNKPWRTHLVQHEEPHTASYNSREATKTCPLCPREKHHLRACKKFKGMNQQDRWDAVKRGNVCVNCLSTSHTLDRCESTFNCATCQQRHHTWLHKQTAPRMGSAGGGGYSRHNSTSPLTEEELRPSSSNQQQSFHQHSLRHGNVTTPNGNKTVLLGTALVLLHHQNTTIPVRALLDSGSEVSCISKTLRKRLGLPTRPANISLLGVNSQPTATASQMCSVVIGPTKDRSVKIECSAFVLPRISGNLPTFSIPGLDVNSLPNLMLADPTFYKSSTVDLLIGADIYPSILLSGVQHNILGSLIAQETKFGWILTGGIQHQRPTHTASIHFTTAKLDEQMRKFWEPEEIPKRKFLSADERFCEDLFQRTTHDTIAEEEEMPTMRAVQDDAAPSTSAPPPKRVKAYCTICRKEHPLRHCRKFCRMSVEQRLRHVVKWAHCAKCLSHLHTTARCVSTHHCTKCERDHNTLLHLDESPQPQSSSRSRPSSRRDLRSDSLRGSLRPSLESSGTVVLLPTVEVVLLSDHHKVVLRALLDPCSVRSEISASRLERKGIRIHAQSGQMVDVVVSSRHRPETRERYQMRAVEHIRIMTPARPVAASVVDGLFHFKLADDHFSLPGHIDMILGGDLASRILRPRIITIPGLPTAQEPIFGWVLSGPTN